MLSLPSVGGRRTVFVEDDALTYGLADFLTGVYPDRMESFAQGTAVTTRLYFQT